MNLAVTTPEYCLTSLTIARNCNSVWNVCLNPNVNIYKCIKVTLLAHLQTPASIQIFITQTSSYAQAVFFLLLPLVTSTDTMQTAATLKKFQFIHCSLTHTHNVYVLHKLTRATYSVVKRTPLHAHAYF